MTCLWHLWYFRMQWELPNPVAQQVRLPHLHVPKPSCSAAGPRRVFPIGPHPPTHVHSTCIHTCLGAEITSDSVYPGPAPWILPSPVASHTDVLQQTGGSLNQPTQMHDLLSRWLGPLGPSSSQLSDPLVFPVSSTDLRLLCAISQISCMHAE